MKKNSNNLISFYDDIIRDVYKKTGGRYSLNQIDDVLFSSISYIDNLCRYKEGVISVRVPSLGYMVCNLNDMKKRVGKLQRRLKRKGYISEEEHREIEVLGSKIRILEDMKKSGVIKNGDMRIKDFKNALKYLRRGYGFDGIQDFQSNRFS